MSGNKKGFRQFLAIRGMGAAITAFIGLIIIYVAFGILNPKVFSGQNVLNLLRSMSKYLLIGIGQSYVMITGNIDLSIGSVVAMSAMMTATFMTLGINPFVAMLISLICGLLIGVINGFLVGKFRLPPFIATLGTMFVGRGVAYMVNGNRNTDNIGITLGKDVGDRFQNFFYYNKTLGVYNTFWIALIIFLVFFFLLSKTRTGRHIYAIGSNVDAARLSGVDVISTTIKTYLVSAFCSVVVGYILCAQAGMGNMEAGNTYEMYGVAAGVIGGVSPLGGSGLLLGTFAGAAVWQTLENGLNMVGAQVGIQRIVIGVIVVGAVLADAVLRNGNGVQRKKK
ncbi:MAG: ABC transporter permease [Lachnospiraceae bacterium]|nr:ABC transporter permease [Lachnospiraceae bacterium]